MCQLLLMIIKEKATDEFEFKKMKYVYKQRQSYMVLSYLMQGT